MRVALVIALCASSADADTKPPEPPQQPEQNTIAIVLRMEPLSKVVTDPPTPSAHAMGIGAQYLIGFPPTRPPPGHPAALPVWFGLGVDVRVLSEEWSDFGALAINGVAKVTGGHAPPATMEVHAGAILSGQDSGAFIGGAVLFSMLYFEVGYSYQREIGVDDHPWLGRHQLTLRGIIPVFTH